MTAQPPEPPAWTQQPQYDQQQYQQPHYWPGYLPPNRDAEHLRLLSIFHYVLAGLIGLFGCMPFIHVGIGVVFITGNMPSNGNGPPPEFGWIFVVAGSMAIIFAWTVAILLLVAAGRLKKRRSWTFCFVTACVSCMFMPPGTALGVFTILVLVRDSVKASFAQAQADGRPSGTTGE